METIYSISQTMKCIAEQEYFWNAVMSILTFCAIIVALFQEKIKNHFYKPKLKIEISVKPPDCHLVRDADAYFFRMRIWNNGTVSAKNVEVIIGNLENEKHEKIDMPQDNLLWSSHEKGSITGSTYDEMKERMYWPYISPGTYQFCNLGFVKKPTKENIHTKFELQVYWPSPNSLHILKHGVYCFDITIGCENGKAITNRYRMRIFKDVPVWDWEGNESKYLEEFEIQKIKSSKK